MSKVQGEGEGGGETQSVGRARLGVLGTGLKRAWLELVVELAV
jgi:hypothetical protein